MSSSEKRFIYHSTSSKFFNDYQYRKMIKKLKIRTEPDEIRSLDHKLLDLLEQSKLLFTRYGIYEICTFRDYEQVECISLTIKYKSYFSSYWANIMTLEYMPKSTPPFKSIYSAYDIWIDVGHLFDDKYAYTGKTKCSIEPFRNLYYHNQDYNIQLINHILFNASISVDSDDKFTWTISMKIKKHGKMHSISGIEYSFEDLIDTLMNRPLEFVYKIYFPNKEVDIEMFRKDPKNAFNLLSMIEI